MTDDLPPEDERSSRGDPEAPAEDVADELDDVDEAVPGAGDAPADEEDESEFWSSYGRARSAVDEDATFAASYGRRSTPRPESAIGGSRPTTVQALDRLTWADLRAHYDPIRSLFKQREALYTSFQRKLDQAKIPQTYDVYLAALVRRMVALVAGAIVLGFVLGGAVVVGWNPPLLTGVGLSRPAVAIAVVVLVIGLGVLAAGGYWLWRRVYRVRTRIRRRRRSINYNLPFAVTFMYALARAGVGFDRIVARLAASTETYGAAAEEFDRVVRETELFGNDLYVGLKNLRATTQSEELARLVDDIIVVLETGGDLPSFLRDEIDVQLQTAVDEQESFVEQLELLSEVFVVGFVATPLFVLVVLMVLTFLGAEILLATTAIIYLVIPLSLAGFVVVIDVVSDPFREDRVGFSTRDAALHPPEEAEAEEWQGAYLEARRHRGFVRAVNETISQIGDDPWRALVFSVPIALAVPVAGYVAGVVPLSLSELLAAPLLGTTELVVAPAILALGPVAAVYEYRRRQQAVVRDRFPEILDLLASSNRRGLSLTRGLDMVSNTTTGRLATELERLRNDVRWNDDLPAAFEAFGDRLMSATLTRTVSLIAEGSRATSDLHLVLGVAATDVTERLGLRRDRERRLQSYLAIVVIGFLVYLLVVILLTANFLAPIEALSEAAAQSDEGPVSLSAVPVAELQLLLFHSALIQGFGSGVLAGKISEGSLYGGLKYGLGLTLLTILVFEGVTFL